MFSSTPKQYSVFEKLEESQTLLDKIKQGTFKSQNPVHIIQIYKNEIDLPSYDMLFSRFVKGDWGDSKPQNAFGVIK